MIRLTMRTMLALLIVGNTHSLDGASNCRAICTSKYEYNSISGVDTVSELKKSGRTKAARRFCSRHSMGQVGEGAHRTGAPGRG